MNLHIRSVAIGLSATTCILLCSAETAAGQDSRTSKKLSSTRVSVLPGTSVEASEEPTRRPDTRPIIYPIDVDPTAPIMPRTLIEKWEAAGIGSWAARVNAPERLTGRIHVKFLDDLRVRGTMQPSTELAHARAQTALLTTPDLGHNDPISEARALMAAYGGMAEQTIKIPADRLRQIEQRAEQISRREQPDLAGMISISVGSSVAMQAAEAFNNLDCVEFATVEMWPIQAQAECQPIDQSLQKGPGNVGDNVIGCLEQTNEFGDPFVCQPGPIIVGYNGIDQPRQNTAFGFVNCNRPSFWSGYRPINTPDSFFCPTDYTVDQTFPNPNWDCTPNCNNPNACNDATSLIYSQGGNPSCQYGCTDAACAERVAVYQPQCTDINSPRGWDATCATIAALVCPPQVGSQTPYNGQNASGLNAVVVDQNTSGCYQWASYENPPPGQQFPFFDTTQNFAYDPCFVLRGPANYSQSFRESVGCVVYTDIGNGQGIRPWGFRYDAAPTTMPAFPYLLVDTDSGLPFESMGLTSPTGVGSLACNAIDPFAQPLVLAGRALAVDTFDPDAILDTSFNPPLIAASPDPTFKAGPNIFSHPCSEVSGFPGCNLPGCCAYVCIQDPGCCDVGWDSGCVSLAKLAPPALCQPNALSAWDPAATVPSPSFAATDSDNGLFARNLQIYTTRKPCVTSTQALISAIPNPNASNPPGARAAVLQAGPNLLPLNRIANGAQGQAELNSTLAFANSQYGGGGLDLAGFEARATSFDNVSLAESRGEGISLGVIDYSAWLNHEDLRGRVSLEEGIQPNQLLLSVGRLTDPDHGTAVLGITSANPSNGIGISGISPAANTIFFPAVINVGGETGGNSPRIPTAIIAAGEQLNPGDVLLVALEFGNGFTASSDAALRLLLGVSEGLGITNVVPAGNGGFPADVGGNVITVGGAWPGPQTPTPVSGLIAWDANGGLLGNSLQNPGRLFPGNRYCRVGSSNWSAENPTFPFSTTATTGVDVAGWGTGICTLGGGSLFRGENPPVASPLETNQLRTYQQSFTGTSGAAAMIAGLTVRLQSVAKAFLGGPVSPNRIRDLFRNRTSGTSPDTVTFQCDFGPGLDLPGTADNRPNVVALGDLISGGSQHFIGGFPDAVSMLDATILTRPPTTGYPYTLSVITGALSGGGLVEALVPDGAFYRVTAQKIGRGSTGAGFGRPLPYAGSGLVADVQGKVDLLITSADQLFALNTLGIGRVTAGVYVPPPDPNEPPPPLDETFTQSALGLVYAWDNLYQRWRYLGWNLLDSSLPGSGGGGGGFGGGAGGGSGGGSGNGIDPIGVLRGRVTTFSYPASNFAVPENGRFYAYVRFVTFSLQIVGPYQVWWDQLLVDSQPLNNP